MKYGKSVPPIGNTSIPWDKELVEKGLLTSTMKAIRINSDYALNSSIEEASMQRKYSKWAQNYLGRFRTIF